ncbi:uncharacterized protein PRCAT00000756001 [Priceomyces carsonii]|uniref:uncharacterized protein n=1 Tax=Priceomyces carsonii TaxID=28549 RepID=UPI002EDA425F|nr:unnamed protein product [Priceomyces carsonii]
MDDTSLRDRQIAILERMLHLNKDGSADLTLATKNEEIIWKVLILDSKSQAILSSVLRVNGLIKCGITYHSLIKARRSPLPDVPAIYFVEPNIENILIIIDDLNNDKYDTFYINFTSAIHRELLEDFAKKVSISGKASKIKQVYDQYLDYIVTEPNLFSLDLPKIFTKFNSPDTTEDQIHETADKIAQVLLSLIITSGSIPIIRCPLGGSAEFVASQLDMKLRDYLSNSRNSSSQSFQQRPVLILLDRNVDLASMFAHSWIYQCMVGDVFKLKRNTIQIQKYSESDSKPVNKSYDIDPKDFFWNKYSQLPFPDAVENADTELNSYKKDAQDLTNKTGITSLNDIDPNSNNDTAHIQQAVEALPLLTARKATLDMHMEILASLISELQAKNLDRFFELEQNAHDPKAQQEFLEVFKADSKRDNSIDKLRTFIILNLITDLPKDFIKKVENLFTETYPGIDLSPLKFILKYKEFTKLTNLSSSSEVSGTLHLSSSSANGNASALLSGLSSKLYGLTEGKISEGLSSFASKIKNFIPDKKQLPVTNITEAIMDPTNASSHSVQITDDYLYLDPKSRGGHSKPPKRQFYQEALVFVIGGGNYIEYQNLQEWATQPNKPAKKVIYGSTEILTANDFLSECSALAKSS